MASRTKLCFFLFLLLVCNCLHMGNSFHVPGREVDCWTSDVTPDNYDDNDIFVNCEGLSLEWITPPPSMVEAGTLFDVSYKAIDTDDFYMNRPGFNWLNSSELREFCSRRCPMNIMPDRLTSRDCCVWHANVHTCHPLCTGAGIDPTVCGPWVQADGGLSTHSRALHGSISTEFEATVLINVVGLNNMIAHIRVGERDIVIQKQVRVWKCGDGTCEKFNNTETCDSCPPDCCPVETIPAWAISVIVIFCVLVPTVITVIALGWYCYQRHKLFLDESWIINYDSIQKGTIYRGSLASFRHLRYMTDEASMGGDKPPQTTNREQIFTQTGVYDGQSVAIRKARRRDLTLNNTVRKEVMQIRMMDHINLCKFIGATVKDPGNVNIITEYCPKGSLNDVLQNDDIPLNWSFRLSFATDIARGMAYLHSKRMYHGRLTSSNCVIDDRWVVKITDYGLPTFRCPDAQDDSSTPENEHDTLLKVYLPPEVRKSTDELLAPATDVYSFAVILVEIATGIDPYSDELILVDNKPKVSFLDIQDSECPCSLEYLQLIHQCWDSVPLSRPTFEQVKKTLHYINPNKESAVDNMMIMMEKYSKHLEVLVADRTQELIAEQERAANLLYSMLPRQVADELKHGKPPGAESFQSVTIFFSDIVEFTRLASESTPMQIVKLLNDLYCTFDNILDHFDVYKVETIGDAYMVVSGVPKKNGINHAGEIASMSLELMKACEKFRIPHRPKEKLKIRAGVHSGPVCAGVVGMKMPRYCLFGDTVNTASRMESTSEAMKIQCSESCVDLLKRLGGFKLEYRDEISVKGKEHPIKTWWLTGKNYPDYVISNPTPGLRPISVAKYHAVRNGRVSHAKSAESFPPQNKIWTYMDDCW